MCIVLIGGGPDLSQRGRSGVESFLRACSSDGSIALLLAGDVASAEIYAPAYLQLFGPFAARIQVMPLGNGITDRDLTGRDGIVVGGGPAPVYHRALIPHRSLIASEVAAGTP